MALKPSHQSSAPEQGQLARVRNRLDYLHHKADRYRLAHITAALDLPGTDILRALSTLTAKGRIHYRTGSRGRGEYRGK